MFSSEDYHVPILTIITTLNQYDIFVIVHYYYALTKPHSTLWFSTQCVLSENTT